VIAELVKHYETLKLCSIPIPSPFFAELPVSIEITLKPDGLFRVDWLPAPSPDDSKKERSRKPKEVPLMDLDCPVTERSSCRASGNDSPHGLVDNPSWVFGKLTPGKSETEARQRGEARREAYLLQLRRLVDSREDLDEVKAIWCQLVDERSRKAIWEEVEKCLHKKIPAETEAKWFAKASKANIRWVVEHLESQGRPVHALEPVKGAWVDLQKKNLEWRVTSLLDGKEKPARLLHPRIKGASLISFNDPATYCGHLHNSFSKKTNAKGDDIDGSALPAQIGFDEAEKYAIALNWLVENSTVRFGSSVNCIWVDQSGSDDTLLDRSAHEMIAPQGKKSAFSRGKAKTSGGQTLPDADDLIESLRRFRNAQKGQYRDKRFYFLSMLLRNKGRHAVLGGFTGTMGDLENNTDWFIKRTTIELPKEYLRMADDSRKFCPTLMDILDAAGVKSEKKKRLVWDREVIEVIVGGRHLPRDLIRLVVAKTIQQKHLEASNEQRNEYRRLLAIGSGCARHYLTAIQRKEQYAMGLDTKIADAGYLAGRLFALCERVQKRGRGWGATLSDKLYSAAIQRPRQTLAQLYQNCLCYETYKRDSEWFSEIFDKINLSNSTEQRGSMMPATGVDPFEFLLGYWHQRVKLQEQQEGTTDTSEPSIGN
jgi:hypothetical protein